MDIVILRTRDPRGRHRFISEPLKKAGHRIRFLDATLPRVFFDDLKKLGRGAWRADAIVSMGPGMWSLLAFLVARRRNIAFVLRLGGNPLEGARSRARSAMRKRKLLAWLSLILRFWISKYMLARCADIIVVNECLVQEIRPACAGGVRIYVIPQFGSGYVVKRSREIARMPCLLTVTNLAFQRKAQGVNHLIDYLAEYVHLTGAQLSFSVVGGGGHLEDVEEHLKGCRLPDSMSVEIKGFSNEVQREYEKADIFLYYSDQDATPNVILEAKRFGIPSLLYDFSSFHQIAKKGCSALFFCDQAQFIAALRRILDDQALREKLGENAQREYEEKFSMEAISKQLDQALATAYRSQNRKNK